MASDGSELGGRSSVSARGLIGSFAGGRAPAIGGCLSQPFWVGTLPSAARYWVGDDGGER